MATYHNSDWWLNKKKNNKYKKYKINKKNYVLDVPKWTWDLWDATE